MSDSVTDAATIAHLQAEVDRLENALGAMNDCFYNESQDREQSTTERNSIAALYDEAKYQIAVLTELSKSDKKLIVELGTALDKAREWEQAVFDEHPMGLAWDPTAPRAMVADIRHKLSRKCGEDAARLAVIDDEVWKWRRVNETAQAVRKAFAQHGGGALVEMLKCDAEEAMKAAKAATALTDKTVAALERKRSKEAP
jgi:hypothetical protein